MKKRAAVTAGVFLMGLAVGSLTVAVNAAAARKYINLPHPIAAPFSDAVLVGDTLYLAGRLGFDASGKPPADPAAEAKLVLDGFKPALAEAGMTMDDIVSVQVFCTDLSLFDTWNGVYRGYFGKDVPARAFIGVASLLRGGHFEMQAIAVKR
ncbi:MAG TPA: RidA family protein [Vicinamibacteria bacterium]|jgi:2-iminobutanoate/2-iminopropanoate deaminase|nr:RidA family protein [Vicinamibacteria bacterium]